jgi:hypothetical protein
MGCSGMECRRRFAQHVDVVAFTTIIESYEEVEEAIELAISVRVDVHAVETQTI